MQLRDALVIHGFHRNGDAVVLKRFARLGTLPKRSRANRPSKDIRFKISILITDFIHGFVNTVITRNNEYPVLTVKILSLLLRLHPKYRPPALRAHPPWLQCPWCRHNRQ